MIFMTSKIFENILSNKNMSGRDWVLHKDHSAGDNFEKKIAFILSNVLLKTLEYFFKKLEKPTPKVAYES